MLINPDRIYRDLNSTDEWQQGDIVGDLYITKVIENDMYISRPHPHPSGRISDLNQLAKANKGIKTPFSDGKENAVIPVFKTDVMIVSQSCDIIHDKKLTVARVKPFLHIGYSLQLQESIRCGNVMYAFYLPNFPLNNDESFLDLTELTVLSKDLLEGHKTQRKKSLSAEGLRAFQYFIERFFGREALPDAVIGIITEFSRNLQNTGLKSKIEKIYYDYSINQIKLKVALNSDDINAQTTIESARSIACNSITHNFEVTAEYKLIDNLLLRDINGFREFR